MPDPGMLSPTAVDIPSPELHEATVLDSASSRDAEVRCVVPSLDEHLATDPMPWRPYITAEGEFWPKSGDRAVVTAHTDGTPLIAWWEPAGGAAAAIEGPGVRAIVHGADREVSRGAAPGVRIWIGSVVPHGMLDNDLLAKYA